MTGTGVSFLVDNTVVVEVEVRFVMNSLLRLMIKDLRLLGGSVNDLMVTRELISIKMILKTKDKRKLKNLQVTLGIT